MLVLDNCGLADVDVHAARGLFTCERLAHLILMDNPIGVRGLEHLRSVTAWKLRKLDFASSTPLPTSVLHALLQLGFRQRDKLKRLEGVHPSGFGNLQDVAHLKNSTSLPTLRPSAKTDDALRLVQSSADSVLDLSGGRLDASAWSVDEWRMFSVAMSVASRTRSVKLVNCNVDAAKARGIAVLAGNRVLTELDLDGHPLPIKQLKGEDPVEAINLSGNDLSVLSAIVIASLIGSNTATKSLDVLQNNLGEEGAKAIVQAAQTKPQLMTLCGIKPDQTEADFSRLNLNVGDAILLAFDLSRNSGLVKLDVRGNRIDDAAKELLRDAAKGKRVGLLLASTF